MLSYSESSLLLAINLGHLAVTKWIIRWARKICLIVLYHENLSRIKGLPWVLFNLCFVLQTSNSSGYLLMQVCWPCLVTSFGYSISLALFLFLAVSSKAAAGCHSVGGLLRLFMIVSCCLTNSSLLIYSSLYCDSNLFEFCCAGAMVFC